MEVTDSSGTESWTEGRREGNGDSDVDPFPFEVNSSVGAKAAEERGISELEGAAFEVC